MTFQVWWMQRHEARIREMERARERRRILAMLAEPEPHDDPTGFSPGCVV